MFSKILVILIINISFFINTTAVLADTKGAGEECSQSGDSCIPGYVCVKFDDKTYLCLKRLIGAGEECDPSSSDTRCISGYSCERADSKTYLCQKEPPVVGIFGKIQPPDALKGLLANDPTGAGGISQFITNLIRLIYIAASIMLLFMLLWGAWDWMTSGGDKEKLHAAQQKILHAIIGIILFAAAFAVIRLIGDFTGFKFFT
ncbi:hypothetical protein HYS94_03405 [Candidatus Daviesbacteria bacterium]|nr:hypothetical protein [Candidatus Daviesbacteria bacterium]